MTPRPSHAEVTAKTVVDLVRLRAEAMGEEVLYRFLKPKEIAEPANGACEKFNTQTISYVELHETAQRIAIWLSRRVSAGDRIVLAFPPGCEYLKAYFGCLYAGVVAVPAYPPRRNQRDQRLHAIIADADVRLALTTAELLDSVKESMSGAGHVQWHSSESIEAAKMDASEYAAPAIDPSTLAFLQYTSGSTGTPKGVMVTHGNLIHNQSLIQDSFQTTQKCGVTGWLPLHHDMGLIGNVLHPLYLGSSLTFMSPIDFLRKPSRWLQVISQFGSVVSGGPNFAYRLCADEIADSDLTGVDLSRWKVAFNGAEPIDADVLDRFAKRFEPYGFSHDRFCPCYGMAETTLVVSSSVRGRSVRLAKNVDAPQQPSSRWVGCGIVPADMNARIVDEQTCQELPLGQTGEIWVSGPSVAAGYWKRPEQTKQTFAATIEAEKPHENSGKAYLRTGDLGWIDPTNGELYVTGRCKDLLIVRGINHYPQDIERTSEAAHDASAIGGCAAFSVNRDGGECLVIVQEIRRAARRTVNADEMVDAIRDAVSDQHQLAPISIVLLRPGALPKTTSGKVQRSEARRQYLEDEFRVEHRWDLYSKATNPPAVDRSGMSQGSARPSESANAITQWLLDEVARRFNLPVETVDPSEPLARYGLDSAGAVRLAGELSTHLGREIPPTLAYEYPTINALAAYLSGEAVEVRASRREERSQSNQTQAIAVVGIGCRFPMADSPQAFYDLLLNGRDAIRDAAELPRFAHSNLSQLDEGLRRGGYLDRVDQFDAGFFGISPREAEAMDPQHRLLLETTHEAFEDAGIPISDARGQSVGVFVGSSHQDYLRLSNAHSVTAYSASGNSLAMAAGRISYTFDFRGPSLTIDTACSSSLVATHQAIRAIRSGDCDYAIASGVNLILSGEATESFAKAGMLSTNGVCSAFDEQANGFVRGEGAATVLMRPLEDAIADGNRIYCVLKGSAINQDGRTNGLTAPSRTAQAALIQSAMNDAGIKRTRTKGTPKTKEPGVVYIEAHGTGTPLGDPIELRAIHEAIVDGESGTKTKLSVGSVKSNIGHLESAAGIAGLIKVALSMHHEQLPPQIHFHQPNPNIAWDGTINIATQPVPWKLTEDQPRLAGVSSFGFSGTNAHVIVEQSPAQIPVTEIESRPGDPLIASGKNEASLEKQIEQIQSIAPNLDRTALAYRLAVGRSHYRHRAVQVGSSGDAIWTQSVANRNPKVDFYFTGQGGVHPGWGKSLHNSNPTFAKHFDHVAESYQRVTRDDLKLRLWSEASAWDNVLIQPAIYSVQVATARFWQSIGVQMHRVVGHSLGEYAAAAIAGVFDFEDGLRLVARRGELAGKIQERGGMLAVFAGESQLGAALKDCEEEWDLAVVNGPRQTLIAGLPDALGRLSAVLHSKGFGSKAMSTTHGFHSRLIQPMLDEFEAFASTVPMASPTGRMVSSQSGEIVTDVAATPGYWRSNLRNAVRFDRAMKTLANDSESIGIEIGAGSALASLARSSKLGLTVIPGMIDHPETGSNHGETLAKLYLHGADLDWKLALGQATPFVSLPTYPFERSRHWLESNPSSTRPTATIETLDADCDSPGTRLDLASDDCVYQTMLSSDAGFGDHRVAGSVVFPAAGIIWWAYQAALHETDDASNTIALDDFQISRSLVLGSDQPRTSQIVLTKLDETNHKGLWSVRDESGWHRHADWSLQRSPNNSSLHCMPLDAPRCGLLQTREVDEHYQQLEQAGLEYGPSYRCIEQLRATGKWAEGLVSRPESADSSVVGMLDAALQVVAATGHHWGTRTWVPVGAKRIEFAGQVPSALVGRLRVQAKLKQWGGDVATADVWIGEEKSGSACIRIHSLKLQATTTVDTESCLFQEVYAPSIRTSEPIGNSPTDFSMTDWYSQMPASQHCALAISDSLESVAGRWVGDILSELGVRWKAGESFTNTQLADRAGVVPAHHRLLNRLLEIAAEEGWLSKAGEDSTWMVQGAPQSTVAQVPQIDGQDEFALLDRCAAATARIMQTGEDPLPLLFPRDGQVNVANVYRDSVGGRRLNHLAAVAVQKMVDQLPPGRSIRILEIGAGTGSTTASVLPHLPADRCRYDFTDIAPGFFVAAKENFNEFEFVNYQVLNVENDPATQGFESRLGTYDLVIAANVLHATADMSTTIQNIAELLRPQGQLFILEGTRPARWLDLTFGLTSGWWRFTDTDIRDHYPLLTCDRWERLLVDHGFEQPHFVDPVARDADAPSHLISSHRKSVTASSNEPARRMGLIHFGSGDLANELLQTLPKERSGAFKSIDLVNVDVTSKETPGAVSDQTTRQIQSVCQRSQPTHWVLMLDFAAGECDSPGEGILTASQSVLDAIQTIEHWCESATTGHSPPANQSDVMVDWITCGSAGSDPKNTLVTEGLKGFWRTVTLEHPQWRCRSIDMVNDVSMHEQVTMLADELLTTAEDRSEIRLSDAGRQVRELTVFEPPVQISSTTGRELTIRKRGSIDGLELTSRRRRKPDRHEVEIRIQFAGLNFRDVLNVLGSYPGNPPLGAECVGTISAVGEGVTDFAIGDRVVAITPETMADFATLPARSVCPAPDSIDATGLATLPVAFLTAAEALESIAQMKAGESVLIHSAAGGVGMAAVQLAKAVGATVYATASRSKHQVIRDNGVAHVYDSRAIGFAQSILDATNGRGVDIVLNSLGEDFVDENLRAIATGGRYVDIALSNDALTKRVNVTRPDISYTTLDLSQTLALHPDAIRSRLEDLLGRMQSGQVRPLPSRTFGLGDAVGAFAWMKDGVNIGKPLIQCDDFADDDFADDDFADDDVADDDAAERAPPSSSLSGVHLISGGLGGLGLLTSDYLIRQGVRDIVLLTRRDPTDREATILDDWNQSGARVRIQIVEINDLDSVQTVVQDVRNQGVPITGVYHLAGVLQDSIVSEQSAALFKTVLDPKAHGGWNLHQATLDDPIEHFVLFSSMSGWLGSPGQANHATANAFLDALAELRQRKGLPAVSIGWGPWARVGSAAKRERLGKGDLAGIGMLMPDEGADLLHRILQGSGQTESAKSVGMPAKLAAGRLLPERLPEHLKGDPLFARLSERTDSFELAGREKPQWIRDFSEYSKERQFEEVMNHLRESIAGALSMTSAEAVPVDSPLFDLGMDSLTSLELVNHLQSTLGVRMSTVELFNFPDVRSLAGRLVELMLTDPSKQPNEDKTNQSPDSCPETAAFDDVTPMMTKSHTHSVGDNAQHGNAQHDNAQHDDDEQNEVSELLREIGDLTDQFDNWGTER